MWQGGVGEKGIEGIPQRYKTMFLFIWKLPTPTLLGINYLFVFSHTSDQIKQLNWFSSLFYRLQLFSHLESLLESGYYRDLFSFQSADRNKSIRINLSDEFATALRGCFQDGAWQGIDVRCSQQDENWSRQGPYVAMRPESAGPLHQRVHDLAPLVPQET